MSAGLHDAVFVSTQCVIGKDCERGLFVLIGLIVFLGVAILFFVFGWLLWKKQRIDLVNAWHTRNVKKEDVPAYTKLMGLSLIAIGAGCLVTGIVACILEETLGWIALPVGFVVGFALIWKAQKKYNGGKMIS